MDVPAAVRAQLRRFAPAAAVLLLQLVCFPMPLGAWCAGLVVGVAGSLAAVGLVLVWRTHRVLNFAQGDLGGFPATLAVLLVTAGGLPWFVGVGLGLVAALAVGVLVDLVVVRRFFRAPRLLLTVATLGLAQVLGFGALLLPQLWGLGPAVRTLPAPFELSWSFAGVVFDGSDLIALVVAPVVLIAVAALLGRTRTGTAVRAAADDPDRALSLGVPVRRLETMVWALVAVLAYVSVVLVAGVAALPFGAALGLTVVARSLAAFVLGRMDDFLAVGAAAVAIGLLESGVRWNTGDVAIFSPILAALVLVGLLVQRRGTRRSEQIGTAWHVALDVRPMSERLARLPQVRAARWGLGAVLAVVVVVLPLLVGTNAQIKLGIVVAFAVVGMSLVVLTGWAGQVSLGQMAFVGAGAAIGAWCTAERGWDPLVAMVAAAIVGAVVAVLVGLPALRLRGLYLSVSTLALSLAVSEWVFSNRAARWIPTDPFDRPLILRRFSIDSPLRIYYLGLVVALTVAWLLRGVRRSRVGRVLVALRDNETNVAAFGISPTRAKLTAFAVSGAVAAVAGVVLVLAQSAFRPATYAAEESISVFVATVIGGPATLLGGVLGAVFQRGAQWLLPSPWSFLATGAGVLVVLLALPGGLAAPLWATRDRFLRWAAERHHLRPSVMVQSDHVDASGVAPAAAESAAPPLLRISDLHVGYDGVPVLSGLHLDVPAGEVVALLGTNGAGKSTLVRAIAGLVPITSGRVWFGGADITEMPPDRIAALGLGQMPGGHGVFPTLTVAENLSVATWLVDAQAEDVGRRIADSLDAFPELADRLAEPAADLSGGQQQMLALAMALIARPELLIIDELSLGLAPTVVGRLSVLVGEVAAAGTTIILVEQSINVALSLATTAVFMERGQIRFAGPARELGERPDLLRAVFLDGGEPAMRSDRRPVALDDTPALEVDAAKRRFGGIVAVDDVSFRVQRSEIVGLIGQNGAGKTTLIDMISGVQPLDGGWARLNGRDLGSLRPSARFRNGLGRTFQGGRLFPGLIVSDAIAVALEHAVEVRDPFNAALRLPPAAESEAAVVRRVEELLEVFGIEEYRDTFTAELSTGTRRIVELACAVAHQPEVLLLDEPAAGVAQREVEELGNLLLRIRDELGCAMVVVEHDVPLLARIADRLVALESGRVIAEGDPASVLADAAVVRSYLGDVAVAAQRSGPFSGNVQGGSGHAGT